MLAEFSLHGPLDLVAWFHKHKCRIFSSCWWKSLQYHYTLRFITNIIYIVLAGSPSATSHNFATNDKDESLWKLWAYIPALLNNVFFSIPSDSSSRSQFLPFSHQKQTRPDRFEDYPFHEYFHKRSWHFGEIIDNWHDGLNRNNNIVSRSLTKNHSGRVSLNLLSQKTNGGCQNQMNLQT